MVQALQHRHIVPYKHAQGFMTERNIEIFMPIYEGNLNDFVNLVKGEAPHTLQVQIHRMLLQVLNALDFVHSRNPPVIHRDVKPPNILYQGDRFLLTDFGIAKTVDTSDTLVGTERYMAPEVGSGGGQTTKVDIWGLGVTVTECLAGLPSNGEEQVAARSGQRWLPFQLRLERHAPHLQSALNVDANERPTARELLGAVERFIINTSVQTPLPGVNLSNSDAPSSVASTILTPMDWIPTPPEPLQVSSLPTQPNESTRQPSPFATLSPSLLRSRRAQPGASRGGFTEQSRSGYQRNRSSQSRPRAPSEPAESPRRTSTRIRRPSSKAMDNMHQEL
ncbi:hypothetical protein J3459_003994 [Metarhizium acridum]|nr:hypothetical protein J3459_003994 [Metarhizium acridum]